ncbi:hypothetical protein ABT007_28020 [Streptomyces griseus]|uniref:hypothetical protein n=1 Tax=Streptomyces griseus TaxID=1911 RepID=UPI003322A061
MNRLPHPSLLPAAPAPAPRPAARRPLDLRVHAQRIQIDELIVTDPRTVLAHARTAAHHDPDTAALVGYSTTPPSPSPPQQPSSAPCTPPTNSPTWACAWSAMSPAPRPPPSTASPSSSNSPTPLTTTDDHPHAAVLPSSTGTGTQPKRLHRPCGERFLTLVRERGPSLRSPVA